MMEKYKKIVCNLFLNIVAMGLPLAALQLCILPIMAQKMPEAEYGLLLTLISVITVISGSCGNSLNNIRLIRDAEYKKKNLQGDFIPVLAVENVVLFILYAMIFRLMDLQWLDIVLLIIMGLLWLNREYAAVTFNLQLNFKGRVLNSIFTIAGYLIGLAFWGLCGFWELVYICGLIGSLSYISFHDNVLKETFSFTPWCKGTVCEIITLLIAAIAGNLLNYADRMFIYPLLGGSAVAVYYTASLSGKVVGTMMSPLNDLMLSYFAKMSGFRKKLFWRTIECGVLVGILGYVVCYFVSYPILKVLYPQYVKEAMKLIPVTTLTAMVSMLNSIVSPFILRFYAMKWQILLNLGTFAVYAVTALLFYYMNGLIGFCIGVLVSYVTKLLVMVVLGWKGQVQ